MKFSIFPDLLKVRLIYNEESWGIDETVFTGRLPFMLLYRNIEGKVIT